MQATERLHQYEGSALEKVFQAVAPVLPPGEPIPYVDQKIHRLIYKDAKSS